MVELMALWLPIILSAVIVFVASSIIHMLLPIHKSEYGKLPDEANVLAKLREANPKPGEYMFPCAASMKDSATPEMQAKFREGPCGFMTVIPTGAPAMGKPLTLWFVYTLVVGICVAYVGQLTLPVGTDYGTVFRLTGTVAILCYCVAYIPNSIWRGVPWVSTLKHLFDGVVYGLLTGGTFGWLWPA